ncbi:MAG: PAS domain S-box protein, partial [Burkholderiaceae bacterium]|nr:PAS domain S-box protein [Burkholderiaceae bacterium]
MIFRKLKSSDENRFQALDMLATLVAVVDVHGNIMFANNALEDAVGLSRRSLAGVPMTDWFTMPELLQNALQGARGNEYAVIRYDAFLKRLNNEPLPVHVVLAKSDLNTEMVVELLPLEQQTRQEREERMIDQALANKELIRNLAHEIKNPLGGIRGAAQLLQMELDSKELIECTQVIVHEADRLQSLVDRLLAPHRRAQVVSDVNIHEVCERVRALILAEFPKGLRVVRDYDISIPEFRGDREQLIQAVLNIAHNAAQALKERIAAGDAE